VTAPCDHLHEIAEVYESAMDKLVSVSRQHGATVLGYARPASPVA
jgi:hypothetical protein